jgi:catechol 2,3-dioxygenase-like lactoylglutathione lyase family enzyme
MKQLLASLLTLLTVACGSVTTNADSTPMPESSRTQLGAFSISLAVKDLAASRAFYEKLGFSMTNGDPAQNWVVLRNGSIVIGLFQGLFERNMLTFNPGWNQQAQPITPFTDVRELQRQLTAAGVEFTVRADESSTGPAYFMLIDPDGNPILVDQHVK